MYVLKFGGSSLSTPQKILSAAKHVSDLHKKGNKVLVVVSAMGKTTDQLIALAKEVSPLPVPRELDMLLTTGERVSMALLCMALHDLKSPAISFTGSQAGILTEGSHFAARIKDINSPRVKEALEKNKIVVLAGFQGFDPITREITTLGRGGSDTTAVAMAKYLKATHCHILKDVTSVYSADPKIVKNPREHTKISYEHLQSMCFWGAKVLHARSVNLASQTDMNLAIGHSETFEIGTLVEKDKGHNMSFENNEIISVNSLQHVHQVHFKSGLNDFLSWVDAEKIPQPQILKADNFVNETQITYSGDVDTLHALKERLISTNKATVNDSLCCITLICHKSIGVSLMGDSLKKLNESQINPSTILENFNSMSFIIPREKMEAGVNALHQLIVNQ